MSARCVGEPVSWLRLERFRLGELPPPERSRVAAHLEGCPACAAAYDETAAEVALPPLPLPATAPAAARAARAAAEAHEARAAAGGGAEVVPIDRGRARRPSRWGRLAVLGSAGGALAAAAALLLVLRPAPTALPRPATGGAVRWKGADDVVPLVVRERDGEIFEGAERFAPGDRWKLVVTCPPDRALAVDVVVLQGGEASFPLPRQESLECGNRVPLPGAFRLDGGAATVCLLAGEALPDRAALAGADADALARGGARCLDLAPEAAE